MIINCLNIAELGAESYEFLKNFVSRERQRKASNLHLSMDAYRSICAEMLLQYSLFENEYPFIENSLEYNQYGKPSIKDNKDFCFNLSHSGDWVVLAYGVTGVGVDIEKIQVGREKIANYIFKEEEREYINSAIGFERSQRLTQIWTLKESYIKYLGKSFLMEMNTFSVNALENIIKNKEGKLEKRIYIKSFLYEKDYYLSICSEEEKFTVKTVHLEDLVEMIHIKNVIYK